MVIMAGMLPGVECARRRRLRQGGSSSAGATTEAPCGTRRPSLCLYAGGHDHAHLGSSSASKGRSGGVCKEMARAWTLDSDAQEAKERLDQKLRGQRESVLKRHQSTGSVPPTTTTKPHATSTSSGNNLHHPGPTPAAAASATPEDGATSAAAPSCVLQQEVFSAAKGDGAGAPRRRRRFSLGRLGRRRPPPSGSEAEAGPPECAVCLEELRGGDVVARLPCAHRFHWSCAVPWVQAASRCPVCRAQVLLAFASSPS